MVRTKNMMMKIGGLLHLLAAFFLFGSCKKETAPVNTAPELRTYMLRSATGTNAGIFTIGFNRDGETVVTIEIKEKSNKHGTTYSAMICSPGTGDNYIKLQDVNAVTGYGETTGVFEASSGKNITANELYAKTGYTLKVLNKNDLIASGSIN